MCFEVVWDLQLRVPVALRWKCVSGPAARLSVLRALARKERAQCRPLPMLRACESAHTGRSCVAAAALLWLRYCDCVTVAAWLWLRLPCCGCMAMAAWLELHCCGYVAVATLLWLHVQPQTPCRDSAPLPCNHTRLNPLTSCAGETATSLL